MNANDDLNAIRRKKMMEMMNANQNTVEIPNEVVEIKSVDHFNELVNNFKENLIIVDFWAPWCGPCRAFAPTYGALQKEYHSKGVIFTKLNTDQFQQIAQQFNISGIPTTVFISGKKVIHRNVGLAHKTQFAQTIDTLLKKISEN